VMIDDDVTHRYHDVYYSLCRNNVQISVKNDTINFNIQHKWKLPIKKY
jgi:hypothetical protein